MLRSVLSKCNMVLFERILCIFTVLPGMEIIVNTGKDQIIIQTVVNNLVD